MALAATQAQAATAGACEGYPVGGTAEISVDVRAQPLALPSSGRYVYDYSASLGPADSQNAICFSGDSRSEESGVGKECVSTCRSRGSPYHSKKTDDMRANSA